MVDNLFTETEISELRDLIKDEHGAFWRTGDWLVRKIDNRPPGGTIDYHNGREEVIKNAAQRSDAKESTLKERYLTSRCFPANRRYSNLSWTLHRRFAEQGQDKAADWMDEFVATGATTIREAADWMEKNKNKKSNAGQESAKAIAKSISAVTDPETKAKEVVRQITDPKVREAILSEVLTEEVKQEAATAYIKAHPEVAVAATEEAGHRVVLHAASTNDGEPITDDERKTIIDEVEQRRQEKALREMQHGEDLAEPLFFQHIEEWLVRARRGEAKAIDVLQRGSDYIVTELLSLSAQAVASE